MKKIALGIEIFGWYGALAIMSAYALVSFSFLEAESYFYQILNATGALGIVAVSFYKRAYPPGVLNSVWFLIAVIAMIKLLMSGHSL